MSRFDGKIFFLSFVSLTIFASLKASDGEPDEEFYVFPKYLSECRSYRDYFGIPTELHPRSTNKVKFFIGGGYMPPIPLEELQKRSHRICKTLKEKYDQLAEIYGYYADWPESAYAEYKEFVQAHLELVGQSNDGMPDE